MKQDFIYRGPATSFAFAEDGKVVWEGVAYPGETLCGLPDDHPHIKALVAAGHLSRASAAADVAPTAGDAGPTRSPVKKGKEE